MIHATCMAFAETDAVATQVEQELLDRGYRQQGVVVPPASSVSATGMTSTVGTTTVPPQPTKLLPPGFTWQLVTSKNAFGVTAYQWVTAKGTDIQIGVTLPASVLSAMTPPVVLPTLPVVTMAGSGLPSQITVTVETPTAPEPSIPPPGGDPGFYREGRPSDGGINPCVWGRRLYTGTPCGATPVTVETPAVEPASSGGEKVTAGAIFGVPWWVVGSVGILAMMVYSKKG